MHFSQRFGWIGVDVGTHTVKLAQTVRDGAAVRLHRAAIIQRPNPWCSDDRLALSQPGTSFPEIRAALECGHFVGRDAIATLPMNACQLRSLNVPPGTNDERRTIIGDELAEEWSDLRGSIEFDFWETEPARTDKAADASNVNVMATSRPWISQIWRDCRRSGLDCWAIDGLPLTMARSLALVGGLAGGRRALAVDWGYSNTTLCIAGDLRPLYTRRVNNCAFQKALDAIIDAFDVTLDEAKFLVEKEGLAPHDDSSDPSETAATINRTIAPTLDELVRQISRTLQFTEMQRRHLQPASVWLMGGGAALKNIDRYLAKELSLPVHIWNLPPSSTPIDCAAGNRSAVFGNAAALSALAWRSS